MNSSGNIVNNMIISRKKTKTVFFVCFFITTFNSLQFSLSVVSNSLQTHGLQHTRPPCPTPTPGFTQTHINWLGWCHPTSSSSLIPFSSLPQSFPASGFFSDESVISIRWPKYRSFSFSIILSNEYWNIGLIDFRMDLLNLLAVQGSLKSHLQHHSSKASILRHSAFFILQLSHPFMTTRKNHSLDSMDLCWQSNVSDF